MIFCTILTAPAAPEPGAGGLNWWALIAGGTALVLIGVPLGLALEGLGGVLTAIGGGLAMVGVAFGSAIGWRAAPRSGRARSLVFGLQPSDANC